MANSVKYVVQNAVDHAGGDRDQNQIASCAVPFIAGIVRQVLCMSRRHAMAPAMGQGAAYYQMHMARQGWRRAQIVAVAVDVPAQLVAVWRWPVLLMPRRGPVLLAARWRSAMHLSLVLPQPLTLPLGVAALLLTRRVAMLVLVPVLMMLMIV